MKFISVGLVAVLMATTSAVTRTPESVSLFATGMDEDAFLDEEIEIKGERFHYLQKKPVKSHPGVRLAQDGPAGYESVDAGAEKVSVLQTPIGATRTTFYDAKKVKMDMAI